jgi:hypothetical protein
MPSFEKYKPAPALSAAVSARAAPDDLIVHYNVAMPSMVYYMRRHIEMIFDERRLFDTLRSPNRVFAVLWAREYETLQPRMPVPTCTIRTDPLFNIKIGAVMAREPLPAVVLITNRCPTGRPGGATGR